MSDLRLEGDRSDAPPPSPELERLLAEAAPVRPRSRYALWSMALLSMVAYGTAWFFMAPVRDDLGGVSRGPLVIGAAVWTLAYLAASWFALVPGTKQVLLDGVRALRVGVLLLVALLASSAICVIDGDDRDTTSVFRAVHCAQFAIWPWLLLCVVTWRRIRRMAIATPWQIGAVLGLASGALSGLLLTFVCRTGGMPHALMGHWGGVVVAAILGGLLGGLALRR